MIHRTVASAVLLAVALPSPALACGGFFCNRDAPVDQSGEDIVFGINSDDGEVTMHVQVAYEGPSEDFAWIVPVSQNPEVGVSTDQLFFELDWRTRPTFNIEYVERHRCENDNTYQDYDYSSYSASSAPAADSAGGTVEVVQQGQVGPYEQVVLRAETTEGLLDWLQDNGYDLPDSLDSVLTPYVDSESYFLALKLQSDRDVGDLVPLALTYPGDAASIPIQLTSVAATNDMRVRAYVLGDHRAVPESYLHVQINDLVVDWFAGGSNYDDAITKAADEAGGHAFATDFSGSTEILEGALYDDDRYDVAALAAAPGPIEFMEEIMRQFVGNSDLLDVLVEVLPLPPTLAAQGVEASDFYNCVSCYAEYLDEIEFDAAVAADIVDNRLLEPLRVAEDLLQAHPHITRMTSSVSPIEMTVDPVFTFNADMTQEVAKDRGAIVEMLCGWGGLWSEAPRRLVLADGRSYDLPSEQWFRDRGMTEYSYLEHLMNVYALVIEATGAEGEPEVMFDYSADAAAEAEAFNASNDAEASRACGCDAATGLGGSLGAVLVALGLVARRRND